MCTTGRTTLLRTETRCVDTVTDDERCEEEKDDLAECEDVPECVDDECDELECDEEDEEWELACEEPEPVTFFTVPDTSCNAPLNPLSADADPAVTANPAAPAARTRPARNAQRRTPAPAASRDSSLRRHPWPPRPDVSIPGSQPPAQATRTP